MTKSNVCEDERTSGEVKVFVSDTFVDAVRRRKYSHREPLFKLAIKNNLNPSTLSRLINRVEAVNPNDKRVLKIGKYLGLNREECFG